MSLDFNAQSWLVDRHVEAGRGERVAVRGTTTLTYGELADLSADVTAGLRSLGLHRDDRVLFVSASMLVMALMAVVQWDALTLDARDTAVLGILPIPKAVIVRSKLLSVMLLASGTCVAWNLAPTVLRGASLPIGLRIGFTG